MELKLFKVKKVDSGYKWSDTKWTKYFLAHSRETVESIVNDRYGPLKQYHYDEEEIRIEITECEVEAL